MNPELAIAATLMAPGALTAPLIAYRVIAIRRATDTAAATVAEHRTTTHQEGTSTPPDGPGHPHPEPEPGHLAEVIDITTRRAA